MGWTLIQPTGDKESIAAAALLLKAGEYKFDLTKSGARLSPTVLESRAYLPRERNYHSFDGEVTVVIGNYIVKSD